MSTDKEEKENVTKSTREVKQSTDSYADNESYNRGDVRPPSKKGY